MKKIHLLIAILGIVLLQSCLKGRDMVLDPAASPNVVEFGNPVGLGSAASDSFRLYSVNYDITPSAILDVPMNYLGQNTAPRDITLKIGVDAQWLARYNTVKATNIGVLPVAAYAIPETVTIKSGQRTVNFPVNFKVDQINPAGSFALPLTITDASGETISKSFGKIIIRVTPKNIYDGIYKVTGGTVTRYTSPTTVENPSTLNGTLVGNPNITLTTVGTYTVEIGNMRWFGGTSGIAGIDNLQATVDPATNQVTMKSIGNATLANIPGLPNTYNPATKTFTLNFDWNQTAAKREIKGLVISFVSSR